MSIFDSRWALTPGDGVRDSNELEALSTDDCMAALASRSVGRIALTHQALPVILPVNYGLLDGNVVFATEFGSKLEAAVVRAIVAFEIDDADDGGSTGWSVCVKGRAEDLVNPADIAAARSLGLRSFCPTELHRFVRIATDVMTGSRVPPDYRSEASVQRH